MTAPAPATGPRWVGPGITGQNRAPRAGNQNSGSQSPNVNWNTSQTLARPAEQSWLRTTAPSKIIAYQPDGPDSDSHFMEYATETIDSQISNPHEISTLQQSWNSSSAD